MLKSWSILKRMIAAWYKRSKVKKKLNSMFNALDWSAISYAVNLFVELSLPLFSSVHISVEYRCTGYVKRKRKELWDFSLTVNLNYYIQSSCLYNTVQGIIFIISSSTKPISIDHTDCQWNDTERKLFSSFIFVLYWCITICATNHTIVQHH